MNNLLDIKTPAQGEAHAVKSDFGLENHGLTHLRMAYWNLPTEALYEEATFRKEGRISRLGPLVVNTGKHTARAATDKFIVCAAQVTANSDVHRQPPCGGCRTVVEYQLDWDGDIMDLDVTDLHGSAVLGSFKPPWPSNTIV